MALLHRRRVSAAAAARPCRRRQHHRRLHRLRGRVPGGDDGHSARGLSPQDARHRVGRRRGRIVPGWLLRRCWNTGTTGRAGACRTPASASSSVPPPISPRSAASIARSSLYTMEPRWSPTPAAGPRSSGARMPSAPTRARSTCSTSPAPPPSPARSSRFCRSSIYCDPRPAPKSRAGLSYLPRNSITVRPTCLSSHPLARCPQLPSSTRICACTLRRNQVPDPASPRGRVFDTITSTRAFTAAAAASIDPPNASDTSSAIIAWHCRILLFASDPAVLVRAARSCSNHLLPCRVCVEVLRRRQQQRAELRLGHSRRVASHTRRPLQLASFRMASIVRSSASGRRAPAAANPGSGSRDP